jgi:hypothetical protein
MKKLIYVILIFFFYGCSGNPELYEHTDHFVNSFDTEYESYGLAGLKHKRETKDGYYQIAPTGRMVLIKILEPVDKDVYEGLMEDLKSHYSENQKVNDVFINGGGTVTIDCRN